MAGRTLSRMQPIPLTQLVASPRERELIEPGDARWAAARRVRARGFLTAPAYRRLRAIKAAVDPGGLFRANHPISA